MAALIGIFVILFFFILAISVFMIVCQWKLYSKAGKPGWACIVPIYNTIVLLEIVKKPIWWIALLMIPIVNFVVVILVFVELAKAYGKDGSFAVGLILLPVVFLPILAFGDSVYIYGDEMQATSDFLDN
jgi:hypothetical protein